MVLKELVEAAQKLADFCSTYCCHSVEFGECTFYNPSNQKCSLEKIPHRWSDYTTLIKEPKK